MFGHFMDMNVLVGRRSGNVHFSLDADPGLAAVAEAVKIEAIAGEERSNSIRSTPG